MTNGVAIMTAVIESRPALRRARRRSCCSDDPGKGKGNRWYLALARKDVTLRPAGADDVFHAMPPEAGEIISR